MKTIFLCLLSTFTLSACATGVQPDIHHDFVAHPQNEKEKIETYWAKPEGDGPFPVIISIHGHQEAPRPGAQIYVDNKVLQGDAKLGYVSVAISQPGYGQSNGSPDFCGPHTQEAVIAVINRLRTFPFVKKDKILLQGASRGAVVASMVATKIQDLAGIILVAGSYDLEDSYKRWKKIGETNSDVKGMVENLILEMGNSSTAFKDRSALMHIEKIKSPTLILNGAKDDRTFPDQSEKLAKLLTDNKVEAKAVIFPELGHTIPHQERAKYIIPFIKKHLKGIQ